MTRMRMPCLLCLLLTACGNNDKRADSVKDAAFDAVDAAFDAEDAAAILDVATPSDRAAGADLGSPVDAADALLEATSMDTGSNCTYKNYTQAEYLAFVDAGTYANLPCGGCAPAPALCNGGTNYNCWASQDFARPPPPSTGNCVVTGVLVASNTPVIWQVCCR
jgi:hypothetical protein